MTAIELIQASNEWNGDLLSPILEFSRHRPWVIAFLILFIAMATGFLRVGQISDRQESERKIREAETAQRRAENLARDKQFCRAIPNSTVAGAQALINITVARAIREARSKKEIESIRMLGSRYTAEARRLSLEQLPECPKILVTP